MITDIICYSFNTREMKTLPRRNLISYVKDPSVTVCRHEPSVFIT